MRRGRVTLRQRSLPTRVRRYPLETVTRTIPSTPMTPVTPVLPAPHPRRSSPRAAFSVCSLTLGARRSEMTTNRCKRVEIGDSSEASYVRHYTLAHTVLLLLPLLLVAPRDVLTT